ncbi:DUF4355 domain-containing protein [Staphylococcus epidermidis]|uniref:capsid assembly scaffolding protein Gp46 family protein n=1 Tax=Staphylococcus epidermidis TaxID=1282 RepID=UPI00178C42AA|nr:DUF4355 domain-containing protein [Staphylococcus epidermidis]MCG2351846.1 DUF4355 domain-containing protein [Staphylococcus epidermidis]MDS3952609.1 DUF4355 domain-containing protein [Staphylococcus epidermidis]MEB6267485.1 DUF4355 domain-containing protein [Staphylococcus epidermidis]
MENNQSNITEETKNNTNLVNNDDQIINILVHTDAETTKKNVEAFTNLVNQMLKKHYDKIHQ